MLKNKKEGLNVKSIMLFILVIFVIVLFKYTKEFIHDYPRISVIIITTGICFCVKYYVDKKWQSSQ